METVETREVGDLTVEVHYDDFADMANPREWTQLGTMLTSHRDYRLGDVQVSGPSDLDGYGTLRNYLVAEHDAIAETIMPLYLFDHSGLSMTTNAGNFRAIDSHGWDWGLVGYIFATPQGLADTGADPDPANLREQLAGEVAEYDSYLRGEVYGYTVTGPDGDTLDSCGGFLGDPDYAMAEAVGEAEAIMDGRRELATREAVGL